MYKLTEILYTYTDAVHIVERLVIMFGCYLIASLECKGLYIMSSLAICNSNAMSDLGPSIYLKIKIPA